MAEGRGKAQAATLRKMRSETAARKLERRRHRGVDLRRRAAQAATASSARRATSSRPTARSSRASPRSTSPPSPASPRRSSASPAATAPRSRAAPRCLSDRIVVEITAERGETFLDRMITLVEGANRQKTPNEIALTILLAVLTIVFLPVVVALVPFGQLRRAARCSIVVIIALLVCLIPTTIGGAPERHRHRGHGPPRPAQRARHERPRGRGGRRRPDAPARQDRDDHARQPHGVEVRARGRRTPSRTGGHRPARLARRRDPRGALHRRARQGAVQHPRARPRSPTTPSCRSPRRRGCRGLDMGDAPDPQGRRRLGARLGGGPRGHRPARARGRRRRASRAAARRRSSSRTAPTSSASSSSRTS